MLQVMESAVLIPILAVDPVVNPPFVILTLLLIHTPVTNLVPVLCSTRNGPRPKKDAK